MGAISQAGTVSSLEGTKPSSALGPVDWINRPLAVTTVQITLTGSGQVDAVVDVQVSNGPASAPIPLDTAAARVSLSSPVGLSSDGFSLASPWRYIRFNVVSLSGTGAAITGLIGA